MICAYCGEYFPSITVKKFCCPECGRKYRKLKGKTKMRQFPFDFFKAATARAGSWLDLDKILKEASQL